MQRIALPIVIFALMLAGAAAFASGDWEGSDRIVGSGRLETERRSVPRFTAIEVEGSGNVVLSQGLLQTVSVESDDNILPAITTEVIGNVLHLGFKRGTRINRMTKLEFRIKVPEITGITISGSGDVRADTTLRADELSLDIRGSGGINADIDTGKLACGIAGSGDIDVRGRSDRLSVTINGSGSVRASGLESAEVEVRINGSGSAYVHATDSLAANLSGSGNVEYRGDPRMTLNASGSGSVRSY
jgi:hypothetical protein